MKPDSFNGIVQSNRHSWIDYARGIAIFLVLYRHVFEGIKRSGLNTENYSFLEHANIIFFSFRMPLFFIISGIFIIKSLQKRGLREFIQNKWQLLLYPYILWAAIQISIQWLLGDYVNAQRSYKDYLYIFVLPREIDQFWYLYALFNVSILYAITSIKLKLSRLAQLILGLVFFFISSQVVQNSIHLGGLKHGGFFYDILHYYIFIAIGDVIASFIMKKENVKLFSSWKSFIIILPVFAACQWYFLQVNVSHNSTSYVEDYQPFRFLLIALSGCIFMTVVSFILQKYNTAKWLHFIGFYSLYIYLMHVLASAATRIFLTKVFGIGSVPLLLLLGITMGLIVPILFYTFATRFGAWWLFSLQKPENKKLTSKNLVAV
ncbi:MAG: acyltransferase [Chitinophagaceae bacterium]